MTDGFRAMLEEYRTLNRAAFHGALLVISVLLVVWLVETDRPATQAVIVEMIGLIVASGAAGWRSLKAEPRTGFGVDVALCWVGMAVATLASVWVYSHDADALATERLLCTWIWATQWATLWRFLRPPHISVARQAK